MKHFRDYKKIVLAVSAALVLATPVLLSLLGCGSSNKSVPEATAQTAPPVAVIPVAPFIDIEKTQGTGVEDAMVMGSGGPATRLWVIDAKYFKIVAAINADGNDGRNKPRETAAHQYTGPDLHDNHTMVAKKDFSRIYAATWGSYDEPSYAIEFDPKTLKETRRAPTGKGTHHCAISPDDKYLYAANEYETFVSVIDLATMTKLKDIEVGGRSSYPSRSSYFYTTDASGKSTATVIPTKYMFVSLTSTPPVSNFVAAPAGSPVQNAIAVIDIATNTLVKKIPIGAPTHGADLSPDGKELWATMETAGITVIDTETLTIKKILPFPAHHTAFSPDNKYGYASGAGAVTKIDRATGAGVWRSYEAGGAHLRVTSDGSQIWVQGTNSLRYPYLLGGQNVAGLRVLSTVDGRLITEVPFINGNHGLDIIPKSAFGIPAPVTGEGATLFVSNCQVCHGAGGFAGASPPLNTGKYFGKAADVLAVIKDGRLALGMPAFGTRLTAAQLQAIADYVATLKK